MYNSNVFVPACFGGKYYLHFGVYSVVFWHKYNLLITNRSDLNSSLGCGQTKMILQLK